MTDRLLAEMMTPATLHLDLNLIRQQDHYVLGLQRWFFNQWNLPQQDWPFLVPNKEDAVEAGGHTEGLAGG